MIDKIGAINSFRTLNFSGKTENECKPKNMTSPNYYEKLGADKVANIYQALNGISFKGAEKSVEVKVPDVVPRYNKDFYKELGEQAVLDVTSRIGKEGQFLNWIDKLPKEQLENIDRIYDLAEQAHEGLKTDIAIIGIGGSRHTTESLVKMFGVDSRAHFYSAIDKDSFNRFKKELPIRNTIFLIVSKSGKTLETTTGYEDAREAVQKAIGREDVSDRFYAITDASPKTSLLRQKVNEGELTDAGVVHDDVGGRFSSFDDATLFTLAYLGVPKKDVVEMLESSYEAQQEFKNPDVDKNDALKLATANTCARFGYSDKHFVEYFGDAFSGATFWEKQMKNESLKANISTDTNVGPGYLHYNAEADLDRGNKTSCYTFVYTRPQDKLTSAVIKGVTTAYKKQHPVSEVILEDLSPRAIGRFIELKHFETLYTGNMLRRGKNKVTKQNEPLPEVIQDNVEKYKEEVRKAMAE